MFFFMNDCMIMSELLAILVTFLAACFHSLLWTCVPFSLAVYVEHFGNFKLTSLVLIGISSSKAFLLV